MANNYAGNEYKRGILAFFHAMRTLFGQALKLADSSDIDGTHSSKKDTHRLAFNSRKPLKAASLFYGWAKSPQSADYFSIA
jgi:hypothetical protein